MTITLDFFVPLFSRVPRRLKHCMKRDLPWSASKDVSVHMHKSWTWKDSCVCLLALYYFWVIHILDQAYPKWQSPKSVFFFCNKSKEEPNFYSQTMDRHSHFSPLNTGNTLWKSWLLCELEKIKLWSKWNFAENKTYATCQECNKFVCCTYVHLHM